MNPAIKLILILRDPVKRLVSDYEYEQRLSSLNPERRLKLEELALTNGSLNISYEPVVASMYDVHVDRWLQLFSRDQLLVLDGDSFIKNPVPVLNQCEDFLRIPRRITRDMFVKDERGYYCPAYGKCMDGKGSVHQVYEERFLEQLRTLYAAHNARLVKLLRQAFTWYNG